MIISLFFFVMFNIRYAICGRGKMIFLGRKRVFTRGNEFIYCWRGGRVVRPIATAGSCDWRFGEAQRGGADLRGTHR